jgi:lipid-A-disaccharide synthase-like uncharacterized protein
MIVTSIGLLAQLFYTARILVQWIKSEKSGKIESPLLFWVFSIMGSSLLFTYGWLRQDFSIIFGEFISFYIYLWNLKTKGLCEILHISHGVVNVLYLVPVVCLLYVANGFESFALRFLHNDEVPLYALVWGSVGQFIYKMRFVYQWYYSHKRKESILPMGFWYMAVTGSLMIIIYGIFRQDWVLVIGQVGIYASFRNIIIGRKNLK